MRAGWAVNASRSPDVTEFVRSQERHSALRGPANARRRGPVHSVALALPPELADVTTGETDPIRYYTRPGIGRMFRRRIEMGLEMIPPLPTNARALEVGYAAGVVLYNLAPKVAELHGLDLDADPVSTQARLQRLGVEARLVQGSVLDMRQYYPDDFFDLVVCFSVLEHLSEPGRALDEMVRVLKPGGIAVLGMPAVNRFMEYAFQAIGFKGIEDHHITPPSKVWHLVQRQPDRWKAVRRSLPSNVPFPMALYHTFRLQKR
jgi:2-polyprenyl-3-methyl-5-hydroxy-6-metoxy-1,4-benzoquinol methylase